MINLALALVWGLFGVVLIAYHAYTGDPRWRIEFISGRPSLGWAALLIAAYNVARWWSYRAVRAAKKAEWIDRARRERDVRTGDRPTYGDPNPDFMFGDEPPPKT